VNRGRGGERRGERGEKGRLRGGERQRSSIRLQRVPIGWTRCLAESGVPGCLARVGETWGFLMLGCEISRSFFFVLFICFCFVFVNRCSGKDPSLSSLSLSFSENLLIFLSVCAYLSVCLFV